MASPFDTLWSGTSQVVLSQVYGEAITLRRGSAETASVTAQKLLGEREIVYDDGGATRFTGCAWIVAVADYQISAVAVTPVPGDRIVESDGTEWAITPIDGYAEVSEQPGGQEWLLMTKRVSSG